MLSLAEYHFSKGEFPMLTKALIFGVIGILVSSIISRASLAHEKDPNSKGLVLTARKWKDDKKALPGSMLYAADLINNSNKTQVLEAIQYPEGYAGGGRFFHCTLESWSLRHHRWTQIWPADFGPRPNPVKIELKPGDHTEACSLMLPTQAGKNGQCVRFRLHTLWKNISSIEVVSNPIVMGDKAVAEHTPCRPSH